MGNFEYRDLAPIDNIENGDKYIEALNWAFQNKKVKNIALTGPYGAGKSSVIETFLAQDDEKNNKGMPYSSEQIDGCTVHTYNDGDLIACFDENVPESVVEKIAKRQPLRVVFRDSGFANSPAKINVTEIFKLLAPDTRVKVI